MDNLTAFKCYLKTGRLPQGFLGLDDAPANNRQFYQSREQFAKWVAKNCAAKSRSAVLGKTIMQRLGVAAAVRGVEEPILGSLVAICLLESSATNAGFGKDQFGTSLAIGPMQTKWAAMMDGGIPYEGYLDLVTDRNPLIGVDAGVGYYLRFALHFSERDSVAKYNNPQTSAETNEPYLKAYDRAKGSALYTSCFGIAEAAYTEMKKWLMSSSSTQGEVT